MTSEGGNDRERVDMNQTTSAILSFVPFLILSSMLGVVAFLLAREGTEYSTLDNSRHHPIHKLRVRLFLYGRREPASGAKARSALERTRQVDDLRPAQTAHLLLNGLSVDLHTCRIASTAAMEDRSVSRAGRRVLIPCKCSERNDRKVTSPTARSSRDRLT